MSLQKTFLRYISIFISHHFCSHILSQKPKICFSKESPEVLLNNWSFWLPPRSVGKKKIHGEMRHSALRLQRPIPPRRRSSPRGGGHSGPTYRASNKNSKSHGRFFEFFRKPHPKTIHNNTREFFEKHGFSLRSDARVLCFNMYPR